MHIELIKNSFQEVTVFGVTLYNRDGKAGMACLVLNSEDLESVLDSVFMYVLF